MMIQLLRQVTRKPSTNPFPVAHMPDSVSGALKAAGEGKIELNGPVPVKEGFRGRIGYDRNTCIGCRLCIKVCPANAIDFLKEDKKVEFHMDRCCFCAQCTEVCPVSCIWMTDQGLNSAYVRQEEVVRDSGPRGGAEAAEEGGGAAGGGTKYVIDKEKCIGCTKCARVCPVQAISGNVKEPHEIDREKCVGCGACADACPVNAISPEE
ncbi:MAG: 4Fe-4S binding protein [Synergistales bacterium]|nr:4Fe-4S binding protein [Synergistales bacterium]